MKPKLTNRQKQAIQTKNKIFDITIALITERGFEEVNIEDICKAADVSVGTFYNYYKSKNEVFYEIYSRADHYFEDHVKHELKMGSTYEGILEYFDYYAIYCENTGIQTLTKMMNASNRNFTKPGRYMQVLLIEMIDEGLKNGQLVFNKTAKELCDLFFMMARGVIFDWCLHDGAYDLRGRVRECLSSIDFHKAMNQ